MRRIPALVPTLVLCAALPAAAQVLTLTPQFSGNSVTAQIQFTGGVEADLSIVFEQAVGLNSSAVALTAALVFLVLGVLLLVFPRVTGAVVATLAFWMALGFAVYGFGKRRARDREDGD